MPKYWNHTLFWLALCLRPAPNNIVIAESHCCDGCATCRWGDECNHWIQVETRAQSSGMITTPLAPSLYQYWSHSIFWHQYFWKTTLQLSQFMDPWLVIKNLNKSFESPCRQLVDKCHMLHLQVETTCPSIVVLLKKNLGRNFPKVSKSMSQ